MNKEFKEILSDLEKVLNQLEEFGYNNFDSDSVNGQQIENSFNAIREELEELQDLKV